MASAWGKSWGLAFGAAWGIVAAVAPVGGDAAAGQAQHARRNAPTEHSAFEERNPQPLAQPFAPTTQNHPVNEQKTPLPHTSSAQAATETIAKQGETAESAQSATVAPKAAHTPLLASPSATPPHEDASDYGTQTAQTIQAAQEEQRAQQAALRRRQDEDLAIIMILLESVA